METRHQESRPLQGVRCPGNSVHLHLHEAGLGNERRVTQKPPPRSPLRKNVPHDCTFYLHFFKREEKLKKKKKKKKGKNFKVRFTSLYAPPGLK